MDVREGRRVKRPILGKVGPSPERRAALRKATAIAERPLLDDLEARVNRKEISFKDARRIFREKTEK